MNGQTERDRRGRLYDPRTDRKRQRRNLVYVHFMWLRCYCSNLHMAE